MSEERNIDKKFFNKKISLLIKNKKVKTCCYPNQPCLSITKEDQINNIRTTSKDFLKDDFNSLTNLMLNKFDSMEFCFLRM